MKNAFHNCWAIGLAVVIFGATGGHGDEPTGTRAAELKKLSIEQLMGLEVATVTAASKKEEKVTAAPATVIVITATDIKLRGYSVLTDVLRDLPGMETTPFFFSEMGTQVPVRGIAGNNKIIVLVNGMRVNPPGGEAFPFRSDFSVRDADQIEVIYGPGSTLYGQDAISCVINVKTKQPTGWTGEVGGAGGLNNEREAWGTFGQVLDKDRDIRLTGYAQYHDSDLTPLNREWPGWWAQFQAAALAHGGAGVTPYREDFGLNLFTRLELFGNTSVQVWHRQSERSSNETGYPGPYVPQAIWGDMSTVVEGKNTLTFADEVTLDSTVTYNRYEIDPATRYVWAPANANSWFYNDYKYGIGQSLTLEETVHAEITDRLSLLAGFMAGTFDIVPKSTVPNGADPDGNFIGQAGSFAYIDPGTGRTNTIPRVVRVCYETYAGYAEANWQMLDKLTAIAGVRITGDTRFNDLPITPRVAFLYAVTPQLTAKYIYTRAYVAPSPYAGYATYDNGTLLATSNTKLDPETAETHEINFTYNKKNLTVSASGYYGCQNDLLITSDQNLPHNIIAPSVKLLDGTTRELVQTVNGGSSHRCGVDLSARATFGPISPWASYSYVDFQQQTAGLTTGLTGISRHNARLGATWAITPRFFITPSLEIRSTPENVPAGGLGSALQTPYEINVYILYELSKHVELFTNLRNITDNHYALGGFALGNQAIPQETFNGVMGVRIHW